MPANALNSNLLAQLFNIMYDSDFSVLIATLVVRSTQNLLIHSKLRLSVWLLIGVYVNIFFPFGGMNSRFLFF